MLHVCLSDFYISDCPDSEIISNFISDAYVMVWQNLIDKTFFEDSGCQSQYCNMMDLENPWKYHIMQKDDWLMRASHAS